MSLIDSLVRSPNFDDRTGAIRMLVLHYTGMKDGQEALERLCDSAAKVSAHYLVWEDGKITRLVAEDKRAWHAGVASWRGVSDVNSASVGIEIVNGGHDFGLPDFPDAQIEAVVALARDVVIRHAIEAVNIVGHSDVAPERKQDPGEKFPWERLAGSGIGIWPRGVVGSVAEPSFERALFDLAGIGYDVSVDSASVIRAFQRRWRPSDISGRLDAQTAGLIEAVSKGLGPG